MHRLSLIASFVALGLFVPASASHAQAPLPPGAVRLPDGGVFLPGAPQGNSTIITGDRYNSPAANQVTPGTESSYAYYIPGQGWATGTTYIGADGRPHGTAVIPNGTGGSVTVNHLTAPGGNQQGGQPAAGQSNQGRPATGQAGQGRSANLVGAGGPAVFPGTSQPVTGQPAVGQSLVPRQTTPPNFGQQFGPRPGVPGVPAIGQPGVPRIGPNGRPIR